MRVLDTILKSSIALMLCVPALVLAKGGEVTQLSGTLTVQKADGSRRILSKKSEVDEGDTLVTQRDSYAQVKFEDGSQMTVRPNTSVRIEAFRYDEKKPEDDNAFFKLLKGGLRTITGLVGKRGNQDAYRISTSAATIGIRGSSGDTLECSQGCDGVTPGGDKLERGLYHTTYTGSYILNNDAGGVEIAEGQFGFVKDKSTAPVLLADDPGLNLIIPSSFGLNVDARGLEGGDKHQCVVR